MKLAPHKRCLIIADDISASTSGEFILKMMELSKSKAPITLFINSGGGDVDAAFAMYDAIKASPCKVQGVAIGICHSSAVLVLQACDQRLISQNCTLMFHSGDLSSGRLSPREALTTIKSHYADMQHFDVLVKEKARVSNKKFAKWCRDGKFLRAQQAIDYGFADSIYNGAKK
jgi:ATP-dependent Clp protease, protease subunit